MRMKEIASLLVSLIILCFIHTSEVSACTCNPAVWGPACQLVSHAGAVFLGQCLGPADDPRSGQAILYRFRVERAYKGLEPEIREVLVNPGAFTSCRMDYKPGTNYLMFAGIISKEPLLLGAGLCSGSRPADGYKSDIDFLERYVQGKTQTEVFGKVLQWSDIIGLRADEERAVLAGAEVVLKNTDHRFTAVSQTDGSFRFSDIPAGDYELSASLDPYLPEPSSHKVSVSKGACQQVIVELSAGAGIEGMLFTPEGKPLKKERVELLRRNPNGKWYRTYKMWAETDEQGRFSFSNIESGEYLLGHEIWGDGPGDSTPWPMYYFPGVANRLNAQVITLAPRQTISGLTLTLPPPHTERTITIKVIWPDGKPPGKNLLQISDKTGLLRNLEGDPPRNVITFTGYQERTYEFEARYWIDNLGGDNPVPTDQKRIAKTDPVKLAPGKAAIEIVLVLRHEMLSKDDR